MTIIKNSFGLNFTPWWPFPWFYSPCPPLHLGSKSHVPRSTLVLLPMSPVHLGSTPHVPRPPWFYFSCPPLRLGSIPHVPSSILVLLPISHAPPWFYGYHPSHPLPLALLPLPPRSTAPVSHSPWFYSPFSRTLDSTPLVLLPQSPTHLGSTPSAPPVLLPLSPTPLGSTPSFPLYPWFYSPRFYSRCPPLPLVLPQVLHSPCYYWKSSQNLISNCACLWFILQLLNS